MTPPNAIQLTPHQVITVVESGTDRLVVESAWDAEAGDPLRHLHPTQREAFEVLEGRLRVVREGRTEIVEAGQDFVIEPGVVHGMTSDDVATRARWEITPALGTEAMFRGLAVADRRGRLAQLRVLAAHRDEFRLASPPDVVQRALLAVVRLLPGG
ncbi:MAG TPA: cupin domain-containing protein [Lapillicoccus sp.]|nr:cupin domain-containing protein [Lapillicoccus sp.]